MFLEPEDEWPEDHAGPEYWMHKDAVQPEAPCRCLLCGNKLKMIWIDGPIGRCPACLYEEKF